MGHGRRKTRLSHLASLRRLGLTSYRGGKECPKASDTSLGGERIRERVVQLNNRLGMFAVCNIEWPIIVCQGPNRFHGGGSSDWIYGRDRRTGSAETSNTPPAGLAPG